MSYRNYTDDDWSSVNRKAKYGVHALTKNTRSPVDLKCIFSSKNQV